MKLTEGGIFVGDSDELVRELASLIGRRGVQGLIAVNPIDQDFVRSFVESVLSDNDQGPFLTCPIDRVSSDVAVGSTRLFISDWMKFNAVRIAHGPDAMLGIIPVVEALLKEGETVDGIEKLQFKSPVCNELNVCAWNDDNKPDLTTFGNQEKIAGTFTVAGSEGVRKINFIAFDTASPIELDASKNCVASQMAGEFSSWESDRLPDGSNVKIFEVTKPSANFEKAGLSDSVNTLIDLVLTAVAKLKARNMYVPKLGSLLYDFSADIFAREEDFRGGERLELTFDDSLRTQKPSGFVLVPIKYEFKNSNGVIGSGIVTIAYHGSSFNYKAGLKL